MRPEATLTALLCRTPLSDEARKKIVDLMATHVQWGVVLETAAIWEVEPVVLHNLAVHFSDAVPEEFRQAVMDGERSARATALTHGLVTMAVAGMLAEKGISAIVIKGVALAAAAYHDPSFRTYSDIDLLVKPQDLIAARKVLVNAGYVPIYGESVEPELIRAQHALELSDGRYKVELHSSLLSSYLRFDLRSDEIWAEKRSLTLAASTVDVLAPHHLFIFLCAHGAKHRWMNPRWIVDIAQMVDNLSVSEASEIINLAGRLHLRRILALGLRAARDIIGADVNPFPSGRLVPESETSRLLDEVHVRYNVKGGESRFHRQGYSRMHPGMGSLLYWIGARERMIDRISCVCRVVLFARPIRAVARVTRRSKPK